MKSKPRLSCVLLVIVVACGVIGLLSALLISISRLGMYSIEQPSMLPSYGVGDRVLVDKLIFRVTGLRRGDAVIFSYADEDAAHLKRIIGMPGEQVQLRDRGVFISGKRLDEPYLALGTTTLPLGQDEWQLGPQEYFVMGDNRSQSGDSRARGPISASNVVGRVLVRFAANP